jgi:hypothetical protein
MGLLEISHSFSLGSAFGDAVHPVFYEEGNIEVVKGVDLVHLSEVIPEHYFIFSAFIWMVLLRLSLKPL